MVIDPSLQSKEQEAEMDSVNKQGKLSGILDHIAFNTRESAKGGFQNTSDLEAT